MFPRTVLLLLACSTLVACNDSTGPDGGPPPGRRVIVGQEMSDWRWLPNGDEILFATRFDYPYSGPPTRLDAVSASTGVRRTVVAAPTDGRQIVGYRFAATGEHAYFQASRPSVVPLSLLRAPIAPSAGAPQVVLDSTPFQVSPSPDGRTVAWVSSSASASMLVLHDVASGTRRLVPISQYGDRVTWSPTGRSVVVDLEGAWFGTGTPFQLVDLASGALKVFLAPADEHTTASSRHIGWEGETAFLYSAGPAAVIRWNIATGAREPLATLGAETIGIGWSPDFEAVVTATNVCLDYSTGPFGGDCLRYRSSVDRLTWRTGVRANVFRHTGPMAIGGRVSPDGKWLAYYYSGCGGGCFTPGDGLYVVGVR
jgi:hypothetical protein